MEGYIHSYETFATLDGGGIRGMVFLSGCKYRCAYCHNPDTWYTAGTKEDSSIVVKKLARNKSYYRNGGITISGGDPLVQGAFTLELLKGFKQEGLHTAIDTSGCVIPNEISEILNYTDLVILDIKFPNEELYQKYVKGSMDSVLKLIELINKHDKEVLLRTVIVPDINDNTDILDEYLKIAKTIKNLKEYELLAYHTLGVDKYTGLGLPYQLEGVKALSHEKLKELQNYIANKLK